MIQSEFEVIPFCCKRAMKYDVKNKSGTALFRTMNPCQPPSGDDAHIFRSD